MATSGSWKPGQSGNPGGRPSNGPLREAARVHTEKAIATLVEIMTNPKASESARVTAATALLDRGYGKPAQVIVGDDDEAPVRIKGVIELVRPD